MVLGNVLGSVVTFVISLLVGGIGIYAGARVMTGRGDFERAVWTALFAALGIALIAWLAAAVVLSLVGFLFPGQVGAVGVAGV